MLEVNPSSCPRYSLKIGGLITRFFLDDYVTEQFGLHTSKEVSHIEKAMNLHTGQIIVSLTYGCGILAASAGHAKIHQVFDAAATCPHPLIQLVIAGYLRGQPPICLQFTYLQPRDDPHATHLQLRREQLKGSIFSQRPTLFSPGI